MRPLRPVFALCVVLLAAAVLLVAATRTRRAHGQTPAAHVAHRQLAATARPAVDASAGGGDAPAAGEARRPRPVYVGIYSLHVPAIDLATNSYLLDFYLWFRWQGNDIDPSKSFEFMNLYEAWDRLQQPVYVDGDGKAKPNALGDRWFYQVFRVQARFTHPFDVHKYPFDDQNLIVEFEDTDQMAQAMTYVPDRDGDLLDRSLVIPGWQIAGTAVWVVETVYPTNFGDTRRQSGIDRYSRFHYEIKLKRPVEGYLVTTILPVAIVMLITLMVFLIESKYFEGRLGLGITSLISAVALQLTAAGDLPKTGYLVLLDHVYNLSYLMIFLALLESVVAVGLYDAGKKDAAKRLDRLSLAALSVVFFGGFALIISLR